MISKEDVDKIFETAKIEEVVSDFVSLKKKGVNYIGNCPFHNEKTPSFIVSPTKGIFKCFGCGIGGNSIKFIMEIEHYSYPEALKFIAKKYNIEIIEKEITKEESIKRSKKESLYIVTKFANDFFHKNLFDSIEGKNVGLSYFKERGFTKDIIEKFNLGYSPNKKNSLSNLAVKKGFDKNILIESGLILKNEKNDTLVDRFSERIIFPIHSFSGRVLGFGGRAFNPNAKAKYLNSPESLIYYKSKVLYGLFLAKSIIAKKDNCFIVEGYTDVLAMHQIGIENVVSASGTALSVSQLKLINRLTENVTLLFDGDEAGIKATYRTINLALKEGINVNVVIFPEGEDPDSYSNKLSKNEYESFLKKNSINFVEYKIIISNLNVKVDPKEIIKIKRDIFISISNIPDALVRAQYCKTYCKKLEIDEKVMLMEVSNARKKIITAKPFSKKDPPTIQKNNKLYDKEINSSYNEKLYGLEKEILRILINYGNQTFLFEKEETSVAETIINDLEIDKITFSGTNRELYEEIVVNIQKVKKININYFINHTNQNITELTVDLLSNQHSISENWAHKHNILTERENEKMKQTTEKAILSLKKCHVDIQISNLQSEIKNEGLNQKEMNHLKSLIELKSNIAKILGRNIG